MHISSKRLYCWFFLLTISSFLSATEEGSAQLQLSTGVPFQDHAVLQQKLFLPIWGQATPGSSVTVEFSGQIKSDIASPSGLWTVLLNPMNAIPLKNAHDIPVGKNMTIRAKKGKKSHSINLKDIVLGEVWIGSGQSNMAGTLRTIVEKKKGPDGKSILNGHKVKTHKLDHYPADTISSANFPALRQLVSPLPKWTVCTPETATEFKKVCYFFSRKLLKELRLPIGVINPAVGGSRIESWLNQAPYPAGQYYLNKVEPIVGYGIRGLLWYQGESNSREGRQYQPKLQSLIEGWRTVWEQPASPFLGGPKKPFSTYFVQLPGIGISTTDLPVMGDGRAEIRQAYFDTLSVPNTGMAIALELGDKKEHPPNKLDTGLRLAQLALHHDYGRTDLMPSGPLYRDHQIKGSTIQINFDHAEGGLMIAEKTAIKKPQPKPKAKLGWISIRAAEGKWHWADAKVNGATLVVSHPKVKHPDAVRYAYTNRPVGPLLYNKSGLPASPFSTCGYDSKEGDVKVKN